jgi:hypothetical protein
MKTVVTNYEIQLVRTSVSEYLRIVSGAALSFSGENRMCACLDHEGLHVVEPAAAAEVVFAPGLGLDARALFALSCAIRRAIHVEEARPGGQSPLPLLAEPCCHDLAHCPLKLAVGTVGVAFTG